MKSLLAKGPALALGLAAFAAPAFAQTGITKKQVAEAVCGGVASIAAKAIMDYHGIRDDDGLTSKITGKTTLPADLEFVETWLEYPRIEARLKLVEDGMASIEAMEKAMQAINWSRRGERALQGARGRPALTSVDIEPCRCNASLQVELEGNVSQLNNLKKQIDEINNRTWKQACEDYKISSSTMTDQNVPVGEAKMARFEVDMPKNIVGWSFADGRIATTTEPNYNGEYTWSAIPQVIGKDGFQVTTKVKAWAKVNFDTGIGAFSPDGLILQQGKVETKKVDVHVYPLNGQTLTDSTTFTVKPPPNAKPGDVYTLTIGPFWGLGVKYSFRVK